MRAHRRIWFAGALLLAAMLSLARLHPPQGTPLFLLLIGAASAGYLLALHQVATVRLPVTWALFACVLLSVGWRVPLARMPLGAKSDAFRYVWDARVVRAGLSPYAVVAADPALRALHTAETRQMNNPGVPTPYPPGAQAFFLLATLFGETTAAIKAALLACDLLLIAVLWRWLAGSGASPWWVLAYAWNPLVPVATELGAHYDVVGALAVLVCAMALARGRTTTACAAWAFAVGLKFLPLVLLPLFWRRVRPRDTLVGAVVLGALYAPFMTGWRLPIGSVTDVVASFRFNAPVFGALARATSPWAAGFLAVGAGLALAAWLRRRLPPQSPQAWAWPMAVALAGSPLVYPWYLVWLVPFCTVPATLPLLLWSVSIQATYLVWWRSRLGAAWVVPSWALLLEYGSVAAAIAWLAVRPRRAPLVSPP